MERGRTLTKDALLRRLGAIDGRLDDAAASSSLVSRADAATTAALPASTLDAAGGLVANQNGALPLAATDNAAVAAGDRLLVVAEAAGGGPNAHVKNYLYDVEDPGGAAAPWRLRRVASPLVAGGIVVVRRGDLHRDSGWQVETDGEITPGATAVAVAKKFGPNLHAPIGHVGSRDGHPAATQQEAGFESPADKAKLDGIEANATADQTATEISNALRLAQDALDGNAPITSYPEGLTEMAVTSAGAGWPSGANYDVFTKRASTTRGKQLAELTSPIAGQYVRFERSWNNSAGAWAGWVETTNHANLRGNDGDHHPQYFNQQRGDGRYSQLGHDHAGGAVRPSFLELPEQAAASLPAPLADALRRYAVDVQGITTEEVVGPTGLRMRPFRDSYLIVQLGAAALPKGTVVFAGGVTAQDVPTVGAARSDAAATMPAVGILAQDIAANGAGRAMTAGKIGGLDTSAWGVGAQLYVSGTTAGALTAVRPAVNSQPVAWVVHSHATQGVLQVRVSPVEPGAAAGGGSALAVGSITEYDGYADPDGSTMIANGRAVSRQTFAVYFNLCTFTTSVTTTNGSANAAVGSKANMALGFPVEGPGIAAGTTIAGIDPATNTITLSAPAGAGAGAGTLRVLPNGQGDGSTTFNIADRRGRTGFGAGQGPGLTDRVKGQRVGAETVQLTKEQMPAHDHALTLRQGNVTAAAGADRAATSQANTATATGRAGGPAGAVDGQADAHPNMPPGVVTNYVVRVLP